MHATESRKHASAQQTNHTGSLSGDHGPATLPPLPVARIVFARVPRLLRYATTEWLVIVCTWVVLWNSPAWVYLVALPILAGRFHALGVVLHDACHMGRRARGPGLWLLQLLAGYPIATTLEAMRYHHLRHHRHSGMAADPYLRVGISASLRRRNLRRLTGLLLVPFWIARSVFGTATLFMPRWRNAYGRVFLQDRSQKDLTHSREIESCLRAEPLQALFFVLVSAAAMAEPAPVLLFYLVPLIIGGAVNVNRVIVEHIHVICPDNHPGTVAAATVTHSGRLWAQLLLFPRNIGFHLVHHLYPQAALESLPDLHAWYLAQSQSPARRSPA